MNIQQSITTCFKKYADFSGRASRSEYWFWVLFVFLSNVVLSVVDGSGLIAGIFMLGVFVPYIAVTARRLHDIDKSGWLQLLYIIPLVGLILWIVWSVKQGTDGENRFGLDPIALEKALGQG